MYVCEILSAVSVSFCGGWSIELPLQMMHAQGEILNVVLDIWRSLLSHMFSHG